MLGVGSRFTVTLNGVPLTSLMLDDLLEVTVNTSLHMPPMFTLRFQDEETLGAYKWIDTPVFPIGGLVTITAISDTESVSVPTPGLLITGEITSLEANFAADGTATLIVRGYHKSHRLNRGKKTATYLMMNDSAIVAKVCASAGVPVTPTPTAVIHEYVLQNNQTDMEFLQARAKRVGYRLAGNNATGIAGVMWNVSILPFKFITDFGPDVCWPGGEFCGTLADGVAAWTRELLGEVEILQPQSAPRLLKDAAREHRFALSAVGFFEKLPWRIQW